jgi:hypothetical protein
VLFPGAEDERHYARNPGEAFAETYRVLTERRLTLPEAEWRVVTPLLLPDATALAAVEQDVVTPWSVGTTTRFSGAIARRGPRSRTFSLATPLDGSLQATVRFAAGRRVTLELVSGGKVLGRTSSRSGTVIGRTTVCGRRAHSVRVSTPAGVATQFALAVSRP